MTQDENILDTVEAADVALSAKAGQARHHPATRLAGFASEIADQPPAFTLAVVAVAAGIVADRRDVAEAGARAFLGLAAVTFIKSAIKGRLTRTRPFMLFEEGTYERRLGGPDDGPWNSFPSGHTANAFVAAGALSRVYPEATAPLMLAATAVGGVQVPRAAHHALDVVAGAALGLAVDKALSAIWPPRPRD